MNIGKYKNGIGFFELTDMFLTTNTLIIAEKDAGKTHLGSKIKEYVISRNVPVIHFDFENLDESDLESFYQNENYIRFEESEAFEARLNEMIEQKKNIYMSVNPNYFSGLSTIKSKLSETIEKKELLDNYYYFFKNLAYLSNFYDQHADFLFEFFKLLEVKKYGLTFLTQPHDIFIDKRIKTKFNQLFVGKNTQSRFFNTYMLSHLDKHEFCYQYRKDHKTFFFDAIRNEMVYIVPDDYNERKKEHEASNNKRKWYYQFKTMRV